ncbi:MAG TPA: outer membrane protein assembly factor BamA [Sphingomicrobium sp.]|nr:outer membrane protein assembly factor BamA [Sphingomicrobium sp.]
MISRTTSFNRRTGTLLLIGTVLGGSAAPLFAQTAPAEQPPAAPQAAQPALAPVQAAQGTIRSITVRGNQRLEPETIRAYANLAPGQTFTAEKLDQALKDLYATQLFADVTITGGETGDLVINVRENPVINRIILEGNKRLKDDKITPEIKLAPRQIFTRPAVRADVDRILELYRRQGRFAARVDPKIVQLDQNRVDVVFEIHEGDLAKIRAINVLGNKEFSDERLRKEMYSRQAGGILGFLKSNDTYDPDRLAADQQKLRAFYLTEGYADFRVVQALAELTPDRRDFVITYVVDEGPRYRFGTVQADSALRDFPKEKVLELAKIEPGSWFNAKEVEDAVTDLNEAAGNLGYAFADISPGYNRDAEKKVMNLTIKVGETPRVYVERIDITGNTTTRDKVIRREFRLNEGDAFNAQKLKRSQDRIQSLGFFSDKFEIKQSEGSAPDRVVLGATVEEKPTGQLSLSGGYSSLERFVVQLGVSQNNFMGKGQSLDASVNWSLFSKSISAGFTDPYFLDKPILLGAQVFRRDYSSFNYIGNDRNTTYKQVSTGIGVRTGFPLSEYWNFGTRYLLSNDKISLDKSTFYRDPDGTGPEPLQCDPRIAGTYLCDEVGKRLTSLVGISTLYDDTDGIHPTRGQQITFSQDFAGLGGDVRFLRTQAYATKFHSFGSWILSLHGEGGYIKALQDAPGPGRDPIRITDRFFNSSIRGFDIRGIGPRVVRIPYDAEGNLAELDVNNQVNDAIGGKAFYLARAELEVPVSASIKSLGLRPSVYVDAGSLWSITKPPLTDIVAFCSPANGTTGLVPFNSPTPDCSKDYSGNVFDPTKFVALPGVKEVFLGNSPKPRVSVGVGVNWISPFGPLRLDLAKAIVFQKGDDPKLFTFNVGTAF